MFMSVPGGGITVTYPQILDFVLIGYYLSDSDSLKNSYPQKLRGMDANGLSDTYCKVSLVPQLPNKVRYTLVIWLDYCDTTYYLLCNCMYIVLI